MPKIDDADIAADLRESSEAWGRAMASVQNFTFYCTSGQFVIAEEHRHCALAHMEASLDAMARAQRKVSQLAGR